MSLKRNSITPAFSSSSWTQNHLDPSQGIRWFSSFLWNSFASQTRQRPIWWAFWQVGIRGKSVWGSQGCLTLDVNESTHTQTDALRGQCWSTYAKHWSFAIFIFFHFYILPFYNSSILLFFLFYLAFFSLLHIISYLCKMKWNVPRIPHTTRIPQQPRATCANISNICPGNVSI